MASVNKVILVGHLGKDPEIRYIPNGEAVANITLATSETWKDKSGEKQEKTEWHRVTFYRRLAEIVGEYLKKGSMIYVEGRLETRKWQDKEGHDRYTTEINASDMKMLSSRSGGGNTFEVVDKPAGAPSGREGGRDGGRDSGRDSGRDGGGGSSSAKPARKGGDFDDFEDDIPF